MEDNVIQFVDKNGYIQELILPIEIIEKVNLLEKQAISIPNQPQINLQSLQYSAKVYFENFYNFLVDELNIFYDDLLKEPREESNLN